ncbi:MAG: nucleotide exchange factor GrpE [Nitrospinaceae bacterium]
MSDPKKDTEQEAPSKFTVKDRRHWAHGENAEDSPAGDEERLPSYVERLKKDAEEKDKRLREYIEAYKSKTSETDEFRQRLQRENEARLDQVKASFFKKLMPLVDNLKRALDAAKTSADFDSLQKGVALIFNQIQRDLQEEGVTMVEAEGKPFDPSLHEAFMSQETDNPALDNMVLEAFEPGYTYKDKLIKPAKVKVGKLKPTP